MKKDRPEDIIKLALEYDGEIRALGLMLKAEHEDKLAAIAIKEYEIAARHREVEVRLMEKIKTLVTKKSC